LNVKQKTVAAVQICLLAGGLSTRMGRDKTRLRWGRYTLLGWVRWQASQLGYPVRVIRRDLVPRCGPLGGVYTALKRSGGRPVVLLSADMPFVSTALLKWLVRQSRAGKKAVFLRDRDRAGFPFVLPGSSLELVEYQLARQQFSLQKLAAALSAQVTKCPRRFAGELFNVNTPGEWAQARAIWRTRLQLSKQRRTVSSS
jgi:molybdopterin-guanine dinucleotide biosynthesis protein A